MTRHLRKPQLRDVGPGHCRLCGEPIIVPDRKSSTQASAIRGAKVVGPGQRLYTRASWHSWCDETAQMLWNPAASLWRFLERDPRCAGCGVDLVALENRRERVRRASERVFDMPGISHTARAWAGLPLVRYPRPAWARALIAMGFARPFDALAEVDHRTPLWEGGAHAVDNLQVLCQPCHKLKTASEAKRRAGRRSRPSGAG